MIKQIIQEAKNEILDEVEQIVKDGSFMDLKDPFKKAGFKVKVLGGDMPLPPIYYEVSKGSKSYTVVNKRYVDKPDRLVGEIAIG